MQISLFIRERGKLRFNPYFYTSHFEVCIDRDGWLVRVGRRYKRADWPWEKRK